MNRVVVPTVVKTAVLRETVEEAAVLIVRAVSVLPLEESAEASVAEVTVVASGAVPHAARCLTPFAQSVEKRLRSRSSRAGLGPSTVGIASLPTVLHAAEAVEAGASTAEVEVIVALAVTSL